MKGRQQYFKIKCLKGPMRSCWALEGGTGVALRVSESRAPGSMVWQCYCHSLRSYVQAESGHNAAGSPPYPPPPLHLHLPPMPVSLGKLTESFPIRERRARQAHTPACPACMFALSADMELACWDLELTSIPTLMKKLPVAIGSLAGSYANALQMEAACFPG